LFTLWSQFDKKIKPKYQQRDAGLDLTEYASFPQTRSGRKFNYISIRAGQISIFCGNPFFTTLGLANDVVNSSHFSEHFFVIKTYTFNQGLEALQGQSIRPKKPDVLQFQGLNVLKMEK